MKDLKQASFIILVWLCLVSALTLWAWYARPVDLQLEQEQQR